MKDRSSSAKVIRYGIYTLDEGSGELHRDGVKVRLAEQPFQVLCR